MKCIEINHFFPQELLFIEYHCSDMEFEKKMLDKRKVNLNLVESSNVN
jgi:hypothetical protein